MDQKQLEKVQVVGLGQACVDYLGGIATYPKEDAKAELANLYMRCGGPACTALVSLSRLGIQTSFLGSISDDPFGVNILRNLKREKVDISHLKVTPGFTSQFAFIAITKNSGKRTVFWHRGNVPHLRKDDVDMRPFSKANILHLDGLMIEASIAAARQAKTLGLTVLMDAGTMREGTKELVKFVDILIASETFAKPLVSTDASPETSLRVLQDLGPGKVVITLGAKGSIGLDTRGIVRQRAFSISAVDTTGAGDVYHGGYIYGLLQGWEMARCMRFASAAAALKCSHIGAQSGIPTLEMVNGLLREREAAPHMNQ
jgi:sulfofructose kinase